MVTAITAVMLAVAAGGCGGGGKHPASSARHGAGPGAGTRPAAGAPGGAGPAGSGGGPEYYVSLGDSYAAGTQATGERKQANTTNGFAYQLPAMAKAKGYNLQLANFACAGATTSSMNSTNGCKAENLGPGETDYPTQPQLAAALGFIKAHAGHIGLITVSIGGNDIFRCVNVPNQQGCENDAINGIKANLNSAVQQLRAAAGAQVPIVGSTYPDVLLALYLLPRKSFEAQVSVTGFRDLLNPTLAAAYASVGGRFADITAASGGYGPWTATENLPPYGSIPVPVAQICQLTFTCQYSNIHPRTAGYTLIAQQILDQLPPRSP